MTEHLTIVDHPLVQHKLSIMREKDTSSASFRRLLHEISQEVHECLAFDVSALLRIQECLCKRKIAFCQSRLRQDSCADVLPVCFAQ